MNIMIRDDKDVDNRLVGHRCKCSGKFKCIPMPQLLAWHWRCSCGYDGWMVLSNIKAGSFSRWLDLKKNTAMTVMNMEMMVNGIIVVEEEVGIV